MMPTNAADRSKPNIEKRDEQPTETDSTLVPMLIAGLVLIIIGYWLIMLFV